jgi:RimJ/RimL family protein N-acetyltransferase
MNTPTPPTIPERLVTPRLLLRVPRAGDGMVIWTLIRDSFDRLQPWMEFAKTLPTPDESEAFVQEASRSFDAGEELTYMIWRREDGVFMGNTGLHHIDWGVPRLEIGYWLGSMYEGHGYVTETVRALANMAFTQLRAVRLEIRCDARNARSAAVPPRCGFTLEATLRRERRDNAGALSDTLIFARLHDERFAEDADSR